MSRRSVAFFAASTQSVLNTATQLSATLCRKAHLCVSVCIVALGFWTTAAGQQVDVLTSRYDNARTGADLNETLLTTSTVNADDFGKLFAYNLDFNGQEGGDVYAQPLYVSHVRIPGKGVKN